MTRDDTELAAATDFLLYQTEDGRTRIQCRLEKETLSLTQAQTEGNRSVSRDVKHYRLETVHRKEAHSLIESVGESAVARKHHAHQC